MDRNTILAIGALLGAVVVVVLASSMAVPTVAASMPNNSTPDYYSNNTTVDLTSGNESWIDGPNATLDRTVNLFTRVGTFVITGSGSASIGAVLTGLLVFGGVVSMIGDSPLGVGGGVVLGTATIATMAVAGFVSSWIWALVVFGVGVVLAAVLIRALR